MMAFDRMVVVARVAKGLMVGRDGEDVVAEVRVAPVIDPAPVVRSVVLTLLLTCAALGFARVAGEGNGGVGLTAAFHDIRTLVDL